MKPSFIRRLWGPSLLLSIPAFFLGFGIAYHQDENQVSSVGNLAWVHFSYAEELKDDMAVIDWAKNLEKLDAVRAFQVISNSKIIAEGGNRNYLPSSVPDGVTYLFPANWTFRVVSEKPQVSPMEFTLAFHSWPGPFLWGLVVFGACFAGSCALGFFSQRFSLQPTPAKTHLGGNNRSSSPSFPVETRIPIKSPTASLKKNTAYLFIDKDYVVRQASPEAAAFLHKKPEQLLNGHLLDLAPDPVLIQTFEKGGEAEISKPFLDHADLLAHLKPEAEGCLVILERSSGPLPL